jgi:hypothetical protein
MNRGSDSSQPGWHQVIPWDYTVVAMMRVVRLLGSRRPARGDQHTHTHNFPPWLPQAAVPDGGGFALHGGNPFQGTQGLY